MMNRLMIQACLLLVLAVPAIADTIESIPASPFIGPTQDKPGFPPPRAASDPSTLPRTLPSKAVRLWPQLPRMLSRGTLRSIWPSLPMMARMVTGPVGSATARIVGSKWILVRSRQSTASFLTGFNGFLSPQQTLRAMIGAPVSARFVKMTFANAGTAIDEVEIRAVPEPSSVALLGMGGLVMLGCVIRRRRRDKSAR